MTAPMTAAQMAKLCLSLSPAMKRALMYTDPLDLMKPGPTRAALMRRGLVSKREPRPGRFGYLTPDGVKARAFLRAAKGAGMVTMTEDQIKALRLTPTMKVALMRAEPGDPIRGLTGGSLVTRGLVYGVDLATPCELWGHLTPDGVEVQAYLRAEAGWE
jgi:hypothetical protein